MLKDDDTDPPGRTNIFKFLNSQLLRVIILISCCGMPPEYDSRIKNARKQYENTFQKETMDALVATLLNERSNMNVIVCNFFPLTFICMIFN